MSILWAHDHKFYKYNDNIYSKVEFSSVLWERYLKFDSDLTVITRLYDLEKDDVVNIENYNISSRSNVEFIGVNYTGNPIKYRNDYNAVKNVIKKHVENKKKVIVRLPSFIGTVVAFEAINQNKPLAVELVGDPWDTHTNVPGIKSKLYAPLIFLQTKMIVAKADQVLYVTKEYLQKRYKNKKGKNINASNVNISIEEREAKILKVAGKINVGMIAFLSPYKGIDTALKSLKEINNKSKIPFYLTILGTGDEEFYFNMAKELNVEKYIDFKTLPAGKPVINWLENLDLYIQPSRTEGLPRGLIEAMSVGLPAVGTNAGGIPELLDGDFIVEQGDYDSLSEKLLLLSKDKILYKSVSKRNIDTASEYDSSYLETKRDSFYKRFIQEG